MQLLLANIDLYEDAIARSLVKFQAGLMDDYEDEDCKLTVRGSDAIISLTGPLSYRMDFWAWLTGGCSYMDVMAKVELAESNSQVKRIVFAVDTPGGEVQGVSEAANKIANCKKPTVAVVDPTCASAGLWLSSQCDKIVSVESGQIGSLGVQAVNASCAEMYAKMGIDVKVFRAAISPDKNLGHSAEPRSEHADAALQSRVDKYGQKFVDAVAKGRGVSAEAVLEKYGQGKMLDAEDALQVGLIDAIGNLQSVLSESAMMKKRKRVV